MFHLPPGCHVFLKRKRHGIRIASVYMSTRLMIVWEWPVYHINIQIIQTEITQTLGTGHKHISPAVHVVPQLGYYCYFVSLHKTFCEGTGKNLSDFFFISICGGAVKQTVSGFYCSVHGFGNLRRTKTIISECAHPYSRNDHPIAEFSLGNQRWINCIHSISPFYSAIFISMPLDLRNKLSSSDIPASVTTPYTFSSFKKDTLPGLLNLSDVVST